MKRRAWCAVVAPLLVIGGCRGVVGIHDLEVVADGGSGGGAEGGTDSAMGTDSMGTDSSTGMDARADGPQPTIDAGCQTTTGMACGMCCRMTQALTPGYDKLAQLAKSTGCVCGAGACTATSECGSDLCGASGQAGMGCGGCVDMATRKMPGTSLTPTCQMAVDACRMNQDCSQVLFCEQSCNP